MISEQEAIEGLYQCLLDFGQIQSSPVLAILPEPDTIEQGIKYPAGNLLFAGNELRAYYHNHREPYVRSNEHGHFHVFITSGSEQDAAAWSHVAALSVDSMGQPQSWFCVNNLVTSGTWLASDRIEALLQQRLQPNSASFTLVERWIFYMLAVYYRKILSLLAARDEKLYELAGTDDIATVLNNRSVYDLAESSIDLLDDLAIMTK